MQSKAKQNNNNNNSNNYDKFSTKNCKLKQVQ